MNTKINTMHIKITRRFHVRDYITNEMEDVFDKVNDGVFSPVHNLSGWRLWAWRTFSISLCIPLFLLILISLGILAVANGIMKSVFPFLLKSIGRAGWRLVTLGHTGKSIHHDI